MNVGTKQNQYIQPQSIEIGEIAFADRQQPKIVQIATGRSHVLALDTAGTVWAWGTNEKG
jgi:alpha-tubulin suppressor-like RCC1 family protein